MAALFLLACLLESYEHKEDYSTEHPHQVLGQAEQTQVESKRSLLVSAHLYYMDFPVALNLPAATFICGRAMNTHAGIELAERLCSVPALNLMDASASEALGRVLLERLDHAEPATTV
jgi:hypothetical protein